MPAGSCDATTVAPAILASLETLDTRRRMRGPSVHRLPLVPARVDQRNPAVSRAFRLPISDAASLGLLGAPPGRRATARTGGPRTPRAVGLSGPCGSPLGLCHSRSRFSPARAGNSGWLAATPGKRFGSAPRAAVSRSVLGRVSGWAQLPHLGVTVRYARWQSVRGLTLTANSNCR
jgi:hypothetical protein